MNGTSLLFTIYLPLGGIISSKGYIMKKLLLISATTLVLFSNSITIYNNNLAHISETQKISLKKGLQELKFANLPNSIIVDSISPIFEDGVKLISQSYKNNPLSIRNLLKENLNSTVEFYSRDRDRKLLKGKLININPTIIESNKKYYIVDSNSIIFNMLPKNIDYKPYIIWSVNSQKAKESSVELSYLLNGINWSSNYTATLSDDTLNLKAWATIVNKSGKEFKDTNIELIAGVVNRHRGNIAPMARMYKSNAVAMEATADVYMAPKSISGYHIYKLPNKVTLLNNQSQQIVMLEAKNIKYKRYAVANNSYFNRYQERKINFSQQIKFKNSKENALGLPLPQGLVRVYKFKHYLGDSRIVNTPKGEKITLNIGQMFDVVGKQKITKYIVRDKYRDVETKYTIKNRSKESIEVKISENIPRYRDTVKFKTSCSGICTSIEKNAFLREFSIKLKPEESYNFTTEFEVYY